MTATSTEAWRVSWLALSKLPTECPDCGDTYAYWSDPEGLWRQCACDCGYID